MDTPNVPQKSPIMMDMDPGTYFWCTCGNSSNQPFCDGAHKGSAYVPEKVVIEEAKKVFWCACKHTSGSPFCDGSHKSL